MNVLVIGSGGREHALCWHIAASPLVDALYCAPGNGGIAKLASCIEIPVMDFDGLIGLCKAESIDFVVIGPEAPLVGGLVDRLAAAGIKAFGPTAAAAELEGSKSFAKKLCLKYGIPTADYREFDEAPAAKSYIAGRGAPIVVKADGLAAGKGVTVATTVAEAQAAVDAAFGGAFGEAGRKVVVEDFLAGEEASFHALVDGTTVVPLAASQDHKTAYDGDLGPNTGGMGAYSPVPVIDPSMADKVMAEIVRPTVQAMAAEGRPYRGVLYCGLMIADGAPKVIEFNCRFGDPEFQVLAVRLKSDLLAALLATADRRLAATELVWHDRAALTVVLATQGYPGAYEKGSTIGNLGPASEIPDVTIFHAGTRLDGQRIVADGGRVLGVTALGDTIADARTRAYEAAAVIDWPDGFSRTDIGWRAINRG